VITGFVVSRLIVTKFEAERPAPFVAEQVTFVPAVSLLIVVEPQPLEDAMPESGSATVHVTLTSDTYQPLRPSVPVTVGVIDGDVTSSLRCVWLSAYAAVLAAGDESTAWHDTRWSPFADVVTSPERVVAVEAVFDKETAEPSSLQSRLATPDASVAVTCTVAGDVLNQPPVPSGD
jgi:hypothetical protein